MNVVLLLAALVAVMVIGALIRAWLTKGAQAIYRSSALRAMRYVDPQRTYSVQTLAKLVSVDAKKLEGFCKKGEIRAKKSESGWQIRGSDFVEDIVRAMEKGAKDEMDRAARGGL